MNEWFNYDKNIRGGARGGERGSEKCNVVFEKNKCRSLSHLQQNFIFFRYNCSGQIQKSYRHTIVIPVKMTNIE